MRKINIAILLLVVLLICVLACALVACSPDSGEQESGESDNQNQPDKEISVNEDSADMLANLVGYTMNGLGMMEAVFLGTETENDDLADLGVRGYGYACPFIESEATDNGGVLVFEAVVGFVIFDTEQARDAAASENLDCLLNILGELPRAEVGNGIPIKAGKAMMLFADNQEYTDNALNAEIPADVDINFEKFVTDSNLKTVESEEEGEIRVLFSRDEQGEILSLYYLSSFDVQNDPNGIVHTYCAAGYMAEESDGYYLYEEIVNELDVSPHTEDSYVTVSENEYIYSVLNMVAGLTYSKNADGSYEVRSVGYADDIKTIVVPSEHNGKPVVGISSSAFAGLNELLSVTLPASVVYIKDNAFADCANLTEVVINGKLTQIGWNAFYACERLESVVLGGGTAGLSLSVFASCTGLQSFAFGGDITEWCNLSGHYSITTRAQDISIAGAPLAGTIIIPSDVATIGAYTFFNQDEITSVFVSSGVSTIGEAAFSDCSGLRQVLLSDGVTYIGKGAFDNCAELVTVSIPDSASEIHTRFEGCGKLLYTEQDGIKYLGNADNRYLIAMGPVSKDIVQCLISDFTRTIAAEAFKDCKSLMWLTLGKNVRKIGNYSYAQCVSLSSIEIGDSVEEVGNGAFYDCTGLTSIHYTGDIASWLEKNWHSNVMSSGRMLYIGGTKVEGELVIPNGIASIPSYAFAYQTGITSVTIPDGMTSIGSFAFIGCERATLISIGKNVHTIGHSAFAGCVSVESLNYNALELDGKSLFDGRVFSGLGISGNGVTLTVGDEVVTVPDRVFMRADQYNVNLKRIVLGAKVEYIPISVIYGCSSVESIDFSKLQGDWEVVLCYDGRINQMKMSAETLHNSFYENGDELRRLFEGMSVSDAEQSFIALIK